ncbi:MAG: hypothetical protein JST35_05275 [Armatimonadetes bacterium]|nr:hypothetical protein [Armatimonadota bacterium]
MKISGMLSGDVKGGKFVLANKEGKVNVDAGNLKALDKSGKSFDLAKLGGGSNLTVWGMKEGMTLKANKIQVNFSRSAEFLAAHPEYAKGMKSPRDIGSGQATGKRKGKGVVSPRDPATGQSSGKSKGKGKGVVSPRDPATGQSSGKSKGKTAQDTGSGQATGKRGHGPVSKTPKATPPPAKVGG